MNTIQLIILSFFAYWPLSAAQQTKLKTAAEQELSIQQEVQEATKKIFTLRAAALCKSLSQQAATETMWKILEAGLVLYGRLDHVKALVLEELFRTNKPDIHCKDHTNKKPLCFAATFNLPEVAELLLKHGAIVDEPMYLGITPLYVASSDNCIQLVKLLIAHNANVSYQEPQRGKSTILMAAAMSGHSEVIQMLIAAGADQTTKDKYGHDALYWAKYFEHEEASLKAVAAGEAERKKKIARCHEDLSPA
jgi:hypothetical protein